MSVMQRFEKTDADFHRLVGVNTVIRVHDKAKLHELDRAIFSLFYQTYVSVSPIIVLQGFDQTAQEKVASLVNRYDWNSRGLGAQIANVPNPEQKDLRSHLLNEGIARADCRFLSILDMDDYLFGDALQWLISGLGLGEFAISFGDIVIQNQLVLSNHYFSTSRKAGFFKGEGLQDILEDNFCPIHSFVLDKTMIDRSVLSFNEKLTRLEDYDFLMRVCSRYPANFETRKKVVGLYNFKSDASNSTITGVETGRHLEEKKQEWDAATLIIAETRRAALANLDLPTAQSPR